VKGTKDLSAKPENDI